MKIFDFSPHVFLSNPTCATPRTIGIAFLESPRTCLEIVGSRFSITVPKFLFRSAELSEFSSFSGSGAGLELERPIPKFRQLRHFKTKNWDP